MLDYGHLDCLGSCVQVFWPPPVPPVDQKPQNLNTHPLRFQGDGQQADMVHMMTKIIELTAHLEAWKNESKVIILTLQSDIDYMKRCVL